MRSRWIAGLFVLLFLVSAAWGAQAAWDGLSVHFVDVGQAEAALLQSAECTILIDAGGPDGSEVVDYLRSLGVENIDLFIVTHPHADHIGQAVQVLGGFSVAEVWMSGYEHYTPAFEELVDAVLASDAAYYEPRTGYEQSWGGLTLQVLNPAQLRGTAHQDCLVVKATYGEISFLFTGDAEKNTEAELVQEGLPLEAQVLQLGHHGSRTSSSLGFLLAVNPKLAIYSAGLGNDYGHPHGEVVDRLRILGIPVFGTDQYGTIVIKTDGQSCELSASRWEEQPSLQCVDLNTASFGELQRIVHIGPERAQQIIEERAKRPFRSIDELALRIEGIGEKRLADIKAQGLACVKEVSDGKQ